LAGLAGARAAGPPRPTTGGCYRVATAPARYRATQAHDRLAPFRLVLRLYVVLDCRRWARRRTA